MISNPGIFKGQFISVLRQKLDELNQKDPMYNFHFVKNKQFKSIGFIRIRKDSSSVDLEA